MHRPHRHRDLLRNFETPPERFRRLPEELRPECILGKLIERKVPADRREHGSILAQAAFFKQSFRKTPANLIAGPRINLPQPAFILPGTPADENRACSENPQTVAQTITVERNRLIQWK